ncbi:MAG: hypothetical protein EPO26_16550 [Chloroflexota bacterium]|nr:MAG: hypothetical protein EPO26_16550 [Chloroflexota bacterium]
MELSLRHVLRIVIASFVLSAFVFAALAWNAEAATDTVTSPRTNAAKANPDPIKASKVLENARKYIGVRYVYGGYTARGFDCSGYVSTIWEIGRRTTDTMGDVTQNIAKGDLLPGDALNYPQQGKIGHIRIFDKWATADRGLVWVFEATEPEVMHRVVPYDPRYIPVRRLNITSDVPIPPPPPLPPDWNKPRAKPIPPPSAPKYPPATIAGWVTDEKTAKPVAKARVFYWTESDQYSVSSVVTGADGSFAVANLPPGMYEMAAYAHGYDVEFRGAADLRTGGRAQFELKLAPAIGDLAGARIGTAVPTRPDQPARDVRPDADPPTTLPLDHEIPGGWFFSQTAGRDGIGGFAVTDEGGIRFYGEFKRLGGVQGVGYPVSRRYQYKGFTVQAMQKGILQWRPEVGQAWLTNVFDEMHDAGKDEWLLGFRSTPRPMDSAIDTGKSWPQVIAGRLAFLKPRLPIQSRYGSVGDPLTFFGLPTSGTEDMGNHYAIRLQRAVIQLWKVDVPWAKAGETTVANGGDVAKEAGLLPASAIAPQRSPILGR